jgi:hypothetical protein
VKKLAGMKELVLNLQLRNETDVCPPSAEQSSDMGFLKTDADQDDPIRSLLMEPCMNEKIVSKASSSALETDHTLSNFKWLENDR